MIQYPAAFSHWGQALWLMEHQELSVFRGRGAVEHALSRQREFPYLHRMAAANAHSNIPVVASKPLQDGLWHWKCDNNGCGLPVKIDVQTSSGMAELSFY